MKTISNIFKSLMLIAALSGSFSQMQAQYSQTLELCPLQLPIDTFGTTISANDDGTQISVAGYPQPGTVTEFIVSIKPEITIDTTLYFRPNEHKYFCGFPLPEGFAGNSNITNGCDSDAVITLVMLPAVWETVEYEICPQSLPMDLYGETVTGDTIFDAVASAEEYARGVDSVHVIVRKIAENVVYLDTMMFFNPYESKQLFGNTVTIDNNYYNYDNGCDSAAVLHAYPNIVHRDTVSVSSDQLASGYEINGNVFYQAGEYTYINEQLSPAAYYNVVIVEQAQNVITAIRHDTTIILYRSDVPASYSRYEPIDEVQGIYEYVGEHVISEDEFNSYLLAGGAQFSVGHLVIDSIFYRVVHFTPMEDNNNFTFYDDTITICTIMGTPGYSEEIYYTYGVKVYPECYPSCTVFGASQQPGYDSVRLTINQKPFVLIDDTTLYLRPNERRFFSGFLLPSSSVTPNEKTYITNSCDTTAGVTVVFLPAVWGTVEYEKCPDSPLDIYGEIVTSDTVFDAAAETAEYEQGIDSVHVIVHNMDVVFADTLIAFRPNEIKDFFGNDININDDGSSYLGNCNVLYTLHTYQYVVQSDTVYVTPSQMNEGYNYNGYTYYQYGEYTYINYQVNPAEYYNVVIVEAPELPAVWDTLSYVLCPDQAGTYIHGYAVYGDSEFDVLADAEAAARGVDSLHIIATVLPYYYADTVMFFEPYEQKTLLGNVITVDDNGNSYDNGCDTFMILYAYKNIEQRDTIYLTADVLSAGYEYNGETFTAFGDYTYINNQVNPAAYYNVVIMEQNLNVIDTLVNFCPLKGSTLIMGQTVTTDTFFSLDFGSGENITRFNVTCKALPLVNVDTVMSFKPYEHKHLFTRTVTIADNGGTYNNSCDTIYTIYTNKYIEHWDTVYVTDAELSSGYWYNGEQFTSYGTHEYINTTVNPVAYYSLVIDNQNITFIDTSFTFCPLAASTQIMGKTVTGDTVFTIEEGEGEQVTRYTVTCTALSLVRGDTTMLFKPNETRTLFGHNVTIDDHAVDYDNGCDTIYRLYTLTDVEQTDVVYATDEEIANGFTINGVTFYSYGNHLYVNNQVSPAAYYSVLIENKPITVIDTAVTFCPLAVPVNVLGVTVTADTTFTVDNDYSTYMVRYNVVCTAMPIITGDTTLYFKPSETKTLFDHNVTLNNNGTAYNNGCDSVYTLLAVENVEHSDIVYVTSEELSNGYTINGNTFTSYGEHTYLNTQVSPAAYYSVLIENKPITVIDTVVYFCPLVASTEIMGRTVTANTSFTVDYDYTTYLVRYNVTCVAKPLVSKDTTVYLDPSEYVQIFSARLSKVDIDTVVDNNCDSVYTVHTLRDIAHTDEVELLPTALPYEWYGKQYAGYGIYYTIVGAGADARYYELILKPVDGTDVILNDTVYICPQIGQVNAYGQTFTRNAVYDSVYVQQDGSETKIIYLHVVAIKLPTVIRTENIVLKPEQVVERLGVDIYKPDTTYVLSNGCDTTLTVNTTYDVAATDEVSVTEADLRSGYTWYGTVYTAYGTYYTVETVNGVKQYRELILTKQGNYSFHEYDTVCQNTLPITWHNQTIIRRGTYYDRQKTYDNYDSIYTLHLNTWPSYVSTLKQSICPDSVFEWRHVTYSRKGTYYDSLLTADGCDSVFILELSVREKVIGDTTIYLKPNQTAYILGQPITAVDATYTLTNNCDSVFTVHTLRNVAHTDEVQVIAENMPYTWRGTVYTAYGTYYTIVAGEYYKLTLSRATTEYVPQNEVYYLDYNDPNLEVYGHKFTQPGTFDSTYVNPSNTNQVIKLHVVVKWPDIASTTRARVPEDDLPYEWADADYTRYFAGGTYYYSKEVAGETLWYKLILTVLDPVYAHSTNYITLCPNQVMDYRGNFISEPGIYYDTMFTTTGKDTVIQTIVNRGYAFYLETEDTMDEYGQYHWQVHGKDSLLTRPGVYFDSLFTAEGCDSVYCLILHDRPAHYFDDFDTICRNELPYIWRGRSLHEGGLYFDVYNSSEYTDSVYRLTLYVNDNYYVEKDLLICEGDSLYYRGKLITEPSIFFDTLTSIHNCDSIIQINVKWAATYHFEKTDHIGKDGTYTWRGRTYKGIGVHYDSLRTVNGCDSVYILNLTPNPSYYVEENQTICQYDMPYEWHGRTYYYPGIYYDSLLTELGNDSIMRLNLVVTPLRTSKQTITLCSGDKVILHNGRELTEAGIYYDTVPMPTGCDSIIEITLNANHTYFFENTATITQGKSYTWHNNTYNTAGVYYDSLKTVDGCDSIYRLTLTLNPVYYFEQADTVCQTDLPYEWHGREYYAGGVYYDSIFSVVGCDSIHKLTLTVRPAYLTERHLDICTEEDMYINGKHVDKPGIYYDSLLSVNGCDSVTKYVVNFLQTLNIYDTLYIADNNSRTWHGQTIAAPGTYYDEHKSQFGCDSNYYLTAILWPTYNVITDTIVCESELPVMWQGEKYYAAGTHTKYLTSVHGTDSILTLNLTINNTKYGKYDIWLCYGETFHWKDSLITAPGQVYDTMRSADGCDSIVAMIVNWAPSYLIEDKEYFNTGGSFMWHGKTYNKQGIYYDSCRSIHGCDSIYRLNLIENPRYEYVIDTTLCERETPFEWRGRQITATGVYTDSMKTYLGNDSIYSLNATIIPTHRVTKYIDWCPGSSFYLREKLITKPGIFYDTIPASNGCDSVYIFIVSPARSYLFETDATLHGQKTYKWRNKVYNTPGVYEDMYTTTAGCDSIYRLILHQNPTYYNDESAAICEYEAPYVWRGRRLYNSGVFYDSIPSVYGTDSVYRLTLTVNPAYLIETQVNLCPNQEYYYRGKKITQAGIYYDTLQSIHGCDSVYMYVVNNVPSYRYETTATISDKQTYRWRGNDYSVSGIYTDALQTKSGCDSIYTLDLTVYPTYQFDTAAVVCQGEVVEWRGMTFAQSGTYYDKYHTVNGYDSIYVFNLTVLPEYESTSQIELCVGETFVWRDTTITVPGIYSDTMMAVGGCDSILHLIVNRSSNYLQNEYAEFCKGGTYEWRGRLLDERGTYFDTLKTIHGCDSIFRLVLNEAPNYLMEDYIELCPGETFFFRGNEISAPGTYYDSLISRHNCDSVYMIVVNRAPEYFFTDTLTLSNKMSETWHGQTISAPGTYYDRLKTVSGCDSIFELVVRMHNTYHYEEYANICNGEKYMWRGSYYELEGAYNETYYTIDGFDSIYTLHLTVLPKYENTQYVTICSGQTYTWRDKVITAQGIYTDSILTKAGCDSILRLVVNVSDGYYYNETMTLEVGQTAHWHGQTISGAGTYFDYQKTKVGGCDSIYELTVEVWPSYLYEEFATICQGEQFTWHGDTYTTNGTYYQRYKSVHRMDSVYCLHLTVNPIYQTDEALTLCAGTTILTHGLSISEPGIYYDSLKSINGCDSVVRIIATRMPSYIYMDDAYLNPGGSYLWRGRELKEAGVYFDSLFTVNGCDSIYKITLHENPVYYYEESDTVCESQLPYIYRDLTIYHAGTYYDSLITMTGMDSVYKFTLVVNPSYLMSQQATVCHGDVYHFRGMALSQSGVYYDTLYSVHGCDSVFMLVLNYAPEYVIDETFTMCEGSVKQWRGKTISYPGTYYDSLTTMDNGCDSIYRLTVVEAKPFLQVDSVVVCQSELPYKWQNRNYYQAGIYADTMMSSYGCDSIYVLNLTIKPTYYSEQHLHFCLGEGAWHNGELFYDARIFMDTFHTLYGCDSIIKSIYEPDPIYLFETDATYNPGSNYTWRGKTYDHWGVYADSFKTVNGCDSVYRLTLHENPVYYFIEEAEICASEVPYIWHDRKYLYTSGIYYDSLNTKPGCDSVFELHLTVHPTYVTNTTDSVCDGQLYEWHGRYLESGYYRDTLISTKGCDSIVTLTLNRQPSYLYIDTVEISDKVTYTWRGNSYSTPGTYEDRFISTKGCDSVYRLVLYVRPTYLYEDTMVICQNDKPYYWRGNHFKQTGTFYDSYLTQYGYDSIYCLHLTVNPSYLFTEEHEICEGDCFHYKDQVFCEPTVYYDSLKTQDGCDSIYKVVINYARSYTFETTANICRGETYTWRGQTFNTSGTYYDRDTTTMGCDSVYQLNLVMIEPFYQLDLDTICSTDAPYEWHKQYYFNSGTYFDSCRTAEGCDSVYELRLVVNPGKLTIDTIQVCSGDTAMYNGDTLTQTTIFNDTLLTEDGCPHIRRVIYNFTPRYFFKESVKVCMGTEYQWHGKTLKTQKVYYDSLFTVNGCDSIYAIDFQLDSAYHIDTAVVVCPDSVPFVWRGREFYIDTVVTDSFVTKAGCDSIYSLTFTVSQKCSELDSIPMCPNDSVEVLGTWYSTPGQYSVKRTTDPKNNNPDSIYRFYIYEAKTYYFEDSIVVCQSQLPYHYNDLTLYREGIYDDTLVSAEGCDSIRHLTFVVKPTSYKEMMITLCPGEQFWFRGVPITKPGVYYDTLYTMGGCDSIVHMVVNRAASYFFEYTAYMKEDGTYPFHSQGEPIVLTKPGTYYDSCRTVSGCDSIYRLILIDNRSFYSEEDTVICYDQTPYLWHGKQLYQSGIYYDSLTTWMGSDSVYKLDLTVNPKYLVQLSWELCQGETRQFRDLTITQPGTYRDTLLSSTGCDSIIELLVDWAPNYFMEKHLTICPDDSEVRIKGQVVTQGGIYYDTLKTINGCDSVFKYIVNVAQSYFYDATEYMNPGGTYVWHSNGHPRTLTEPGVYFDSCRTDNGCDSIYRLELLLNKGYLYIQKADTCESYLPYMWRGQVIYQSGTYYDSLYTYNGMDSVYRLDLTVHSAYLVREQWNLCKGETRRFRDLVITQPGIYRDTLISLFGCDSVVEIIVNWAPNYFIERQITICPNDEEVRIKGQVITQGGIYYDTLKTANGCDSVFKYIVNVAQSYFYNATEYMNPGGTYVWHSNGHPRTLTEPGVYFDSCRTVNGCDSVYRLELLLNNTYLFIQNADTCEYDMPYIWRGRVIYEGGTYYDSLHTFGGRDSVYVLNLNVHSAMVHEEKIDACFGEPLTINEVVITHDTIFNDTILTGYGCDSIVRYIVAFHPVFTKDRYESIGDNQYYVFYGDTVHNPGIYYHHHHTVMGCDSIIKLILTVHPTYYQEVFDTICQENLPYIYHRKEIRKDTTILDTFRTVMGYDSIVANIIHIAHKIPQTVIPVTLCDGDYLAIRGHKYYDAGNYYDTLYSHLTGCDSVLHYIVNKGQTYHIYQEVTFCENGSYQWRGHHNDTLLTRPGTYYDSLISTQGCDSIIYLLLKPKGVYLLDTTILVCYDELPYTYQGRRYYTSEEFIDTFTSYSSGCDSICHIRYQLTNKCSEYNMIHRCINDTFYVDNNAVYSEGLYRFPQWTSDGLDSVYRIVVQDAPIYEYRFRDTICQGDTIYFEGMACYQPRTYTMTYETQYGCDSTFVLSLAVNPTYQLRSDIDYDTIADYELPYRWQNRSFYETGIFYDTLTTRNGCDSVLTLRLRVYETDTVNIAPTICRGDSFQFNGIFYYNTTYTEVLNDYRRYGYSQRVIFDLTVLDTTRIVGLTFDEACADDYTISMTPAYVGARPATYNVEFMDTKAFNQGFVNLIDEPYTGSILIPMPRKSNGYYVSPGYYRIRLSLDNGYCYYEPLDTTILVRYPSSVMHQKWNDVVALYSKEHNGGYVFIDYSWQVLNKNITSQHSPYLVSEELFEGDQVVVYLTRKGDSQPIPSCPLTIVNKMSDVDGKPVIVTPNQASREAARVKVVASEEGKYIIYDSTGKLCSRGTFMSETTEVELPPVSGCYLMQITTADGYHATERILIY